MEFGLKGTSRVCRGRHGEVGIVECGNYDVTRRSHNSCTFNVNREPFCELLCQANTSFFSKKLLYCLLLKLLFTCTSAYIRKLCADPQITLEYH